ncbi:DUF4245 domain-containing protein [Corynebacterium sp. zg331]|uniref:DUF4245 domain-containing protein n=1 Tax=unclassified Corynebacterium TaxID=2624378 RepID=UPI00351B9A10
MAEKPRLFQDGRDMMLSLGAIVVMMVVGVGATGLCSFDPGNPENGPVPTADAAAFLGMEAAGASFPVRLPEAPEGWVSNSARRTSVGGRPAPTVGYITDRGGYLQLAQTDLPGDEAARGYDDELRDHDRTIDVAGTATEVYASSDREVRDLWVADLGDARLLISGAATEEEFRALIEATAQAQPLRSASGVAGESAASAELR